MVNSEITVRKGITYLRRWDLELSVKGKKRCANEYAPCESNTFVLETSRGESLEDLTSKVIARYVIRLRKTKI